jgi:hypothetical protein
MARRSKSIEGMAHSPLGVVSCQPTGCAYGQHGPIKVGMRRAGPISLTGRAGPLLRRQDESHAVIVFASRTEAVLPRRLRM